MGMITRSIEEVGETGVQTSDPPRFPNRELVLGKASLQSIHATVEVGKAKAVLEQEWSNPIVMPV